jgi:KaiC/GvpD/RAD55 family RecA-like ATPase
MSGFDQSTDGARASSGIRGLDELLAGGFPANRAVLISGDPGTGKSTFGLQFLAAGIMTGEPGVCVSVDQKPQHLLHDAAPYGWNLDSAVATGMLTVLDASPYFTATRNTSKSAIPIDARNMATELSKQIRRTGAKRLVIDSLTSLVPPLMTRSEAHDYLRSLVLSLEDNMGCTVLLTSRACSPGDPQAICEAAGYLVSGILELGIRRSGGSFVRTLFVKKMRGTSIEPGEYPFQIEPSAGLSVLERSRMAAPPTAE